MNNDRHTLSHVEGKGYPWVVGLGLIEDWLKAADDDTYDQIIAAIRILATVGPGLGRPLVDTIVGSRHNNMRSEEHTSEIQSLMRISYAVFCLKKKQVDIINLLS